MLTYIQDRFMQNDGDFVKGDRYEIKPFRTGPKNAIGLGHRTIIAWHNSNHDGRRWLREKADLLLSRLSTSRRMVLKAAMRKCHPNPSLQKKPAFNLKPLIEMAPHLGLI